MGTPSPDQRVSDEGEGEPPKSPPAPSGEPQDKDIVKEDPTPTPTNQTKKIEENTIKVAKTELLHINLDQNLPPLASPCSDLEIPIHLQYARFPKPMWPKSPITIPSSFFRDIQHQRVCLLNNFEDFFYFLYIYVFFI